MRLTELRSNEKGGNTFFLLIVILGLSAAIRPSIWGSQSIKLFLLLLCLEPWLDKLELASCFSKRNFDVLKNRLEYVIAKETPPI